MADIYIGLMSGTSADSIDCATLDLSSKDIKVLDCRNFEIPKDLRKDVIQSSQFEKIEKKLVDNLNYRMAEVLVSPDGAPIVVVSIIPNVSKNA